MPNIRDWFSQPWQQFKQRFMVSNDDRMVPLDQVSRFYQSNFYQSLDANLKSAFYDGPLGGLDSRIIHRKDVDTLMSYFKLWQQGRNISCAIYGEKGTGLSTLLNTVLQEVKQGDQHYKMIPLEKRIQSEQDFFNTLSKSLGVEEKTYTLDEFIACLLQLPPSVIAIDNLHFLVQRTLDAQAVVDSVSAIIIASAGHHFWLLASEEQAWRRLCYGYGFEQLVSHQHHVANFNESDMRELLINRFAYAGFHTINDIATEKLHSEKSPINHIAKRCKGCVELGLFYCLNNLTYGTKPQSILLMPADEIDMTSLKKLSQKSLFTLAEISTHGQLSPKEHSKVFRMEINESKRLLEHLRRLGVLDKNEDANSHDGYSLKLIISAVVIRYLISMNYLY